MDILMLEKIFLTICFSLLIGGVLFAIYYVNKYIKPLLSDSSESKEKSNFHS